MIRFLDLSISDKDEKNMLLKAFESHLDSGMLIIKDAPTLFEKKLANICERKFAVGVNTGTDALVLAIRLLDLPLESKILTSPFSWIASSSSIKLAGHCPVFIDIDDTLQMDLDKLENYLEKNRSDVKAILIPHLHGNVSNLNRLRSIKKKFKIRIIEDCAQAFMAYDNENNIAGHLGDISAFSFNAMKVLGSLGDAGAIVFDDESLLARSYSLRHSGMCNLDGEKNSEISGNFRLQAIQSSFLNIKLEFLKKKIARNRELAYLYKEHLPEEIISVTQNYQNSNHYCFQIILPSHRDELMKYLIQNNVEVKIRHDFLISEQKNFEDCEKESLTNAKTLVKKIICLPLHNNLTNDDVRFISDLITKFYKNI